MKEAGAATEQTRTAVAGGDEAAREISPAEYEQIVADELNKPEGDAGGSVAQKAAKAEGPEGRGTQEQKPEAKVDGKPATDAKPEEPTLSDEDKAVLKELGIEDPKAVPAAMLTGALSVIRGERKKAADAENTARLYASQNKTLSSKYQDLKKQQASDPKAVLKTLKAKLTPEFLERLPETTRRLVEDDDMQMATLALLQLAQGGAEAEGAQAEAAPGGAHEEQRLSPEQEEVYRAEVQRQLDESGKVITEAGFKDFQGTYRSQDFLDWFKGIVDGEVKLARRISPAEQDPMRLSPSLARWWSPNPAGHIDILTRFNSFKTAKSQEDEKARKLKEQQDGMAGHGPVGKGATVGSEMTAEDIMSMSDKDFAAYDQRVRAGGRR